MILIKSRIFRRALPSGLTFFIAFSSPGGASPPPSGSIQADVHRFVASAVQAAPTHFNSISNTSFGETLHDCTLNKTLERIWIYFERTSGPYDNAAQMGTARGQVPAAIDNELRGTNWHK
jgi:hypothetical protein